MTFAFSDLLGLAWIFAFPAFLHIINAYNGRNRGITVPRSPVERIDIPKTQRKPVKSNRGEYSEPHIKVKPEITYTTERTRDKIKIVPAPVKYTPQDTRAPAVTLARPWVTVCCILPKRIAPAKQQIYAPMPAVSKPAKFKKARKPRAPSFEKLTHEDISDLKAHLSIDIFKRLNYFELAHLKTAATKRGIDDWVSLLDSRLSYEENKLNLIQQYGAHESDSDLMQKYRDYQDLARQEYTQLQV